MDRAQQLARLILDEVNVKEYHYFIAKTEKGDLELVFDYNDCWIELGGKKINAPKIKKKVIEGLLR